MTTYCMRLRLHTTLLHSKKPYELSAVPKPSLVRNSYDCWLQQHETEPLFWQKSLSIASKSQCIIFLQQPRVHYSMFAYLVEFHCINHCPGYVSCPQSKLKAKQYQKTSFQFFSVFEICKCILYTAYFTTTVTFDYCSDSNMWASAQ